MPRKRLIGYKMGSAKYAAEIVSYLIENKSPQRLVEISKALHMSGSTAYRILGELKDAEWIVQDPETKRYETGIGLLTLALSLISQLDLRKAALPFIDLLNNKVGESVTLSMRVGLERIYIYHAQSDHELQHAVTLGQRLPLWCGAQGKAILAYLGEKHIEQVLSFNPKEQMPRIFASGRPVDEDKLRKELGEVRRKGFSVSSGERVAGTNAVSAPIFDCDNRVMGSLAIGGPEVRFNADMAKKSGPLVKEFADNISRQLGNFFNIK